MSATDETTTDPTATGRSSSPPVKQSPRINDDVLDESLGEQPKPLRGFARIYRSPIFNVVLVGLISFTQPGIWNALNSKDPPSIYTWSELPADIKLLF
jgi:hypothetical protein